MPIEVKAGYVRLTTTEEAVHGGFAGYVAQAHIVMVAPASDGTSFVHLVDGGHPLMVIESAKEVMAAHGW